MITKIDNEWSLNNSVLSELKDCTDIDLGFSPLTNTFPIHRLGLTSGKKAKILAAWVKFPSFEVERLEQIYTCIDNHNYVYESGTSFKAKLRVNDNKFVIQYPDYWELDRSFENIQT